MKKLLTHYLILTAFGSFAQNKTIDSLQQALKNYDAQKLELRQNLLPDESDTAKVKTLNDLSWQFIIISDYDAARKYTGEAMVIGQQINYKQGIGRSHNLIGNTYYFQGNYPEALKNYFAALKLNEETGNKKGIANSYKNIGIIYFEQGNYPEALKNYFAALKIREDIGDKNGIANSYNNIGIIYEKQGNYPEALKNYFASIKINEETGDKYGIANSYNNIGITYKKQGNYPEALKNHFAALKLNEEIGNKKGNGEVYSNIGTIYDEQGNYPEALKNQFAALKLNEETGNKEGIAISCINIGNAKISMLLALEGKDWLLKGLHLAKELKAIELLKHSYRGLATADSALGNFKGAYENHKLFVLHRDSVNNEEVTKKSLQTTMQYEFDKKEAATKAEQEKKDAVAQKELQKQKLVRNGFVGGFAVVLLFAGVFFTQRNKIKKGKQRSDELLLNILPSQVAEELKVKGSAEARQFDEVTVMFTDFKNFTQISEKLSPSELVAEIHTCFKAFDNIIGKHNIEKIKTIGDAYMSAGGLPVANKTNATDVVSAAMEIQQFMQQHLQQRKNEGKEPFEIRIGIHTGPVVAGIVGVKKFAYDIWGDTVNIASRMENSGEAGKVNISGATYELVKDKFNCTHRGKISAKNKGEIDMYFAETIT